MPGIKIGSDSLIGAGLVVDKDIPTGSFCVAKPNGYEIKKNAKKVESHGREAFKSKI
jgi:acetyltransferase-like isoleucine patch superfamily enzyme